MSRSFSGTGNAGRGVAGELEDLRGDVELAFLSIEAEIDALSVGSGATNLQEAYDGGEVVLIGPGVPIDLQTNGGVGLRVRVGGFAGLDLSPDGLTGDADLTHFPIQRTTVGATGRTHTLLSGDGGDGDGGTVGGDGGVLILDAGVGGADGGAGAGNAGSVSIGTTNAVSILSGSGSTLWTHLGPLTLGQSPGGTGLGHQITLWKRSDLSDPAGVANSGQLYTKDASGVTELFFVSGDGTVTQLTPGGAGATDHGALTGLEDDDHEQYLLVDGTRAMSGVLQLADGAVGTPGLTFSAETDTGLYRPGADQLGVSVSGTAVATFVAPSGTSRQILSGIATAAATPFYSFAANPDRGMYNDAAGLGFAVAGGNVLILGAATHTSAAVLRIPSGSVSSPAVHWSGEVNTGMWFSAGAITLAVTGGNAFRFQSASFTGMATGNNTQGTSGSNSRWSIQGTITSDNNPAVTLRNASTYVGDGATGVQRQVVIESTINQTTGTPGFVSLDIARTETAVGSGRQEFIRCRIGAGTDRFLVLNSGIIQVGDGAAATPSLSFVSGTGNGFFHANSSEFGVATGGTERWRFSGNNLEARQNAQQIILCGVTGGRLAISGRVNTGAGVPAVQLSNALSFSAGSGVQQTALVLGTVNQSSDAGYQGLRINISNTSLGSGENALLSCQVGGTTVALITNSMTASEQGCLRVSDGSATTPSLSFLNGTNLGFYAVSSSIMGLTAGGANRWQFGSDLVAMVNGQTIRQNVTNGTLNVQGRISTAVNTAGLNLSNFGSYSGTASGTQKSVRIADTLVQITSSSGYTAFEIDLTQTSIGSGTHRFLDLKVGGTTRCEITSGTDPGLIRVSAGGSSSPGYSFLSDTTTGLWLDEGVSLNIAFGGADIVRVTPLRVELPEGFNSANPGWVFNNDTNTGIYWRAADDMGFTTGGVARMHITGAAVLPEGDNAVALGSASERWSDVFAVQTTIGDLNMRDPHAERGDTDAAHWKLVEGKDGIYAYNIRTGKKYSLSMHEESMTEDDAARVEAERVRYAR